MAKIKIYFVNRSYSIICDATEEQFNQIWRFMNKPKHKKYKCFIFGGKNSDCLYVKDKITHIEFEKDEED